MSAVTSSPSGGSIRHLNKPPAAGSDGPSAPSTPLKAGSLAFLRSVAKFLLSVSSEVAPINRVRLPVSWAAQQLTAACFHQYISIQSPRLTVHHESELGHVGLHLCLIAQRFSVSKCHPGQCSVIPMTFGNSSGSRNFFLTAHLRACSSNGLVL